MIKSLTTGRQLLNPEDFSADISSTLCFTGHREKSIPPYDNRREYQELTYIALRLVLGRYIDIAINSGFTTFISGFAEGVDLWAAYHVAKRKKEGHNVQLIGVLPYIRHCDRFSFKNSQLLHTVETQADDVIVTCNNPEAVYSSSPIRQNQSNKLYRDRNYFMVDNSSSVIAFVNENLKWSGTHQTVRYAEKNGLKICRFGLNSIYTLMEKCSFDLSEMKEAVLKIGIRT